jgi:hypothetical protein
MTGDTDYIRRLLDETRDEVARADTKASIVLAGSGVVISILLSGFVTGDIDLAGERWYVGVLVWVAGLLLLAGVAFVGLAVYPQVGTPTRGRARWFAEVAQYGEDEVALAKAIAVDREDRGRDLHQARVLAGIVARKYSRTKVGMRLLGAGLAVAGLAALLTI